MACLREKIEFFILDGIFGITIEALLIWKRFKGYISRKRQQLDKYPHE